MTTLEFLKLLEEKRKGKTKPVFEDLDLTKIDWRKLDVRGCAFVNCAADWVDMTGANLQGTYWHNTSVDGVDLTNVDARWAVGWPYGAD